MPIKRASGKHKSPRVFGHPGKRSKTGLRAALYARVSSHDQQTLPMQNRALREYAARRGWTTTMQVKEVGSGAAQRQMREKLMEAARRRDIDVVLVWRLDRWGRSVADLLATLQELEHLGVGFVSLTEALDLTTPAGRAMAALLAVFAEFEREVLRERVRAGLAHARQNGKRLGRPVTAALHADQVRKLYAPVLANRKSAAGSTSAAPRCVVSYHRKRADMTTKRINTAQDIYGIKVTLLGTKPPIWRRLLVPASMTLAKLHDVLQTAMGWHDCHMHEFRAGERHFGRPDPEDISMGMQVENERNIRLSSVLRRPGAKLIYTYDFGDNWEHAIVLEKLLPLLTDMTSPICIDGSLACPPDDCGGIPGFYELLDALADPNHEQHQEMHDWIGGDFDPLAFSVDEVNRKLTPKRLRSSAAKN
jgi:putative DNA-invertase from lambdoid prophage Rac